MQIATGHCHTILLDRSGNAWGCGDNKFYSQLGFGRESSANTLTLIPMPVGFSTIKKVLSQNTLHTFVLDRNGNIFGCGNNRYGQLGIQQTNNKDILRTIYPLDQLAASRVERLTQIKIIPIQHFSNWMKASRGQVNVSSSGLFSHRENKTRPSNGGSCSSEVASKRPRL